MKYGKFVGVAALSLAFLAQAAEAPGQVEDVSKWTTFTNRGGWSIKHPGNLKIESCRQCPDPTAPGVPVIFRDPGAGESMLVEPLADRPAEVDVNKWLEQLSQSVVNPRVKEEWIYLDGRLALKVTNRRPDSVESENVYFVNGLKTFAIRISDIRSTPFYGLCRQMLSTFRL